MTRGFWLPTCAVALVAGCASVPRVRGEAGAAASGQGSGTSALPAPADEAPTVLRQRLDALAASLAPRGLVLERVVGHGFLTHTASVTTAMEIGPHRCVSIVAFASTGVRDLDAHLFDPSGDLLVEDVETDAHPTVQLCTSEARRVYHVIEAFEGQGAWLIALFAARDRSSLEGVGAVLGGRPGTAGGGGASRSDIERRLGEFRDGIARRGFQVSGDPSRLEFSASGSLRLPLPVTPDRCVTLGAFAEGGIADVDVVVRDPDGEELARDVRPERDGFVQLCPPLATTLSVEVRARGASGSVLLQAFAADAASAGGANGLWLGERLQGSASTRPIEEMARTIDSRARDAGFTDATTGVLGRGETVSLAPGEVREVDLAVPAARCSVVTGVGGRGVGRISLDAYQGDSRVGRGVAHGIGAAIVQCAEANAASRVRVRVAAEVGGGEVRLWSAMHARRVAPWMAERVSLPDGTWSPLGEPETMSLRTGEVLARPQQRPAGQCRRWALHAGRPWPRVQLTLRTSTGAVLSRAAAEGSAAITRCGPGAEDLRLEADVQRASVEVTEATLLVWSLPDPHGRLESSASTVPR